MHNKRRCRDSSRQLDPGASLPGRASVALRRGGSEENAGESKITCCPPPGKGRKGRKGLNGSRSDRLSYSEWPRCKPGQRGRGTWPPLIPAYQAANLHQFFGNFGAWQGLRFVQSSHRTCCRWLSTTPSNILNPLESDFLRKVNSSMENKFFPQ